MTPRIELSAACRRTTPPAISSLMQTALANPDMISLAAGFVDGESLPVEATARAVAEILADPREGRRALQYGTTRGDDRLRERLAARLERADGVPAGAYAEAASRMVITTGSSQLLYLVAEALVDPGDIVLVESPTYFVFLGAMETRGARVVGVETDSDGLRIDSLEETLAELEAKGELGRVRLIYTVTEHANPTGNSLSGSRRRELLEAARRWSKEGRIYILEDAAYRGLGFDGPEPPSVWSLDEAGDTVIHARTFSKTLSPGIRVGYGILPEALLEPVLGLKGNHDFGSPNFNQVVVERLLSDGAYDRHVEGLVGMYRRKRDALLDALGRHFDGLGGVTWTRPSGGLYVWLSTPEGLDTGPDGPLFPRCVAEGVLYVPGAFAFAEAPGPVPTRHARICYGVPGEDDLDEGARRLAAAMAACLDPVA